MPIPVASFFLPRNGNSWYLIEDTYLKGGLRVVPNFAALSGIHPFNLKIGMLAVAQDTGKLWQLNSSFVWTEFLVDQSTRVVSYTHQQSGPSDVWIVEHAKNTRYFTYTVFEASGRQILPNEAIISSADTVFLQFSTPVSGHATFTFDLSVV